MSASPSSAAASSKKTIAFRAQTDELYEIETILSIVQSTSNVTEMSESTYYQRLFDALMRMTGLPFRLSSSIQSSLSASTCIPIAHTPHRLALLLSTQLTLLKTLQKKKNKEKNDKENNLKGNNDTHQQLRSVKISSPFASVALSDSSHHHIGDNENDIALLISPSGSLTVLSLAQIEDSSSTSSSADDDNSNSSSIQSIIATVESSLIAPPDGIVSAAVRLGAQCDFADTASCAELLLLGGDAVLRRVHCRRGAPLHPLPFALPGDERRTACDPVTAALPLHAWHGSANVLAWSGESTRLLAVAGAASGEASELRFSLSIWRFDDDDGGRPIPLYSSELGKESVPEGTRETAGPLAHTFAPLVSMRRVRRSLDANARRAAIHRLAWSRDASQLAGADLVGNLFVWLVDVNSGATTLRHAVDSAVLDRLFQRADSSDAPPIVSDVAWWSDRALVVSRSNGDVLLINVGRTEAADEPLRALTAVEHFHAPPLLARGHSGTVYVVVRQAEERRVLHRELVDETPGAEALPARERVRVSLLHQCSPVDLLQRLVMRMQYADATALCQRYQLSADTVLAAQFASTAVSSRSIADLLAPLDVEYQLRECTMRVGETEVGQLALLSRGFELTLPDSVRHALPSETSAQPAMLDDGAPMDDVERGEIAALGEIELSARDVDLCLYRLVLLAQLDRLCTYGRVSRLDAANNADAPLYSAREFLAFRDAALVDSAARFAQRGNAAALACILAHHAVECAELWLPLVALLPPGVSDADVLDTLLVPSAAQLCSPSARVWRKRDWIERAPPKLLTALGLSAGFSLGDVFRVLEKRRSAALARGGLAGTAASYTRNVDDVSISREPRSAPSRFAAALGGTAAAGDDVLPPVELRVRAKWLAERNCAAVDTDAAVRWCEARVRWLDAAHGRLDAAADWLAWAAARGLSDERLRRLSETAQQLCAVVYDMPASAERVDRVLSLAHYEALELEQRVATLLDSASTSVDAMRAVMQAMLVALRADEAVNALRVADATRSLLNGARYDSPLSALHTHVLQLSAQLSAPRVQHDAAGVQLMPFECASAILIATGSECAADERAIADDAKLMFVALQCAYACPLTDARTLAALNALYNALPSAPRGTRTPAEKELDAALVAQTDLFAKHLSAVEVLAQRGMAQPLAFFRDCVQQHQKARTLLRQLAQSLTRQGAKREQWAHLRADLLVVCEAVPFVHEKFCLELFCGALLLAREYKLAQENLAQLEGGEALCLTTARDLVNGSTTLSDESLREARKVLQLVRPTPALQQELALIDACDRLSTLRLPQAVMPPIQVRLTPQPLTLIDTVLQHNELLYIDAAAVLALARGIGASSEADVFAVRCLIANAALRANDPETALTHARLLLAGGCTTSNAVRVCIATARGMLSRNAAVSRELTQAVLLRANSDELAEVMAIERLADTRLLAARHNYDGVAKAPSDAELAATLAASVRNFDAPLPTRTRVHHAFYADVFGEALCDDAFATTRTDRRGVAELYLIASATTATPNDIAALRAHLAHSLRADTAHAVGVLLALARDGVDRALVDAAADTLLQYATNTPGAAPIALWCAAMAAHIAEQTTPVATNDVESWLALPAADLRARLAAGKRSTWRTLLAELDKVSVASSSSSSSSSSSLAAKLSHESHADELAALRALEPSARVAALLGALADAKESSDNVLHRVGEPLVQLADAAHADTYSEVAVAVLQRLFADESARAHAQALRERLALKSLPNKVHDDALLVAVASSPLVALTSPHKANRQLGYTALQQQQPANATVSDDVCEVLLARCKKDCGVHAVVHFSGAVRRALVRYIVARAASDADDDGAPRRASDAYAALAHCAIAGQWKTVAQLAMAVSHCGDVGGGLVSGVAATAVLLRLGEQRASLRCQRAAERGDVPAEKAWRDDAALLVAAQATCKQ